MTATTTHLWRVFKWGRTLGRHGALIGLEKHPATPPALRRLFRVARLGSSLTQTPDISGAFQKIGPAAVKLGQTLATRPDVVGMEAAQNLKQLQDALPPLPFAEIEKAIAESLDRPIDSLFQSIDPVPVGAASVAQVHKAVTSDGRIVAVKVLRTGIEEKFASDISTYEWIAMHAASRGGELARLRPREVVASFRQWTERELDLRREAASASELAEAMSGVAGYHVPNIDWQRTSRRVLTLDWVDGIKLNNIAALDAAGIDRKLVAQNLIHAFLQQAIAAGFFHADLHQGNLFAQPDGSIAAIDFGIMGRVNRQARLWLAEILHGLITGNYRRVAEIHFDAQYVPAHHNIDEFTSALRTVGEPIRGMPVKDISVGNMLESLFAITRAFDMQTQPHLLLLQKTMAMVEGVASELDPEINMWDASGPFVAEWLREELGPEARIAEMIHKGVRLLSDMPGLLERIDGSFPKKGAAPPLPPLPEPPPARPWLGRIALLLTGAMAGAAALYMLG